MTNINLKMQTWKVNLKKNKFNSIFYTLFTLSICKIKKILDDPPSPYKAFRHVETLFIQDNIFIRSGPLLVGGIAPTNSGPGWIKKLPWMNLFFYISKGLIVNFLHLFETQPTRPEDGRHPQHTAPGVAPLAPVHPPVHLRHVLGCTERQQHQGPVGKNLPNNIYLNYFKLYI